MPGMGMPPPEMAGLMEALASVGAPTAGDMVSQAVTLLNQARKLDDKLAPIASRAIDILKGNCNDDSEENDDFGSPMNGPSSKNSDYTK